MASLLGMDIVPPAVLRKDIRIGELTFPLGVMVYSVADVRSLESVPPEVHLRLFFLCFPPFSHLFPLFLALFVDQLWGEPYPLAVVSNGHILDALIGGAPRKKEGFKAGRHWAGVGEIRPCLLEHSMGSGRGELHSMWAKRGDTREGLEVSFCPFSIFSWL